MWWKVLCLLLVFKIWCSHGLSFIKFFPIIFAPFLKLLTQHCQYPLTTPRAYKKSALKAHCIWAYNFIVHSRSQSEIIASEDQWIMKRQLGLLCWVTLEDFEKGNRASWLDGLALWALWSFSHMSPLLCLESCGSPQTRSRERESERDRKRVGEEKPLLVMHLSEIQCAHMWVVIMKYSNKYAC